jgi:hypothetical protein
MVTLANLGMTRLNPDLVKANCRRAFRAALIPIRTDLEMTLVQPLERRTFSDLPADPDLGGERARKWPI